MDSLNKKGALSQKELECIAEHLDEVTDSESEAQYDSDEASDNGEGFFPVESVSETEDELEFQSEEESDEEPDQIANSDRPDRPVLENDENNGQSRDVKYIAKSGLEWNSRPLPRTRRLQKNIVNARPGITQYSESAGTILEFFNLFLTAEIKDIICLHTNQEASRYFDS